MFLFSGERMPVSIFFNPNQDLVAFSTTEGVRLFVSVQYVRRPRGKVFVLFCFEAEFLLLLGSAIVEVL